jgi:hypothetical protein
MMATDTAKRLNDVSRVLIAVAGMKSEPSPENGQNVLDAIERLDKDGSLVLLAFAQAVLGLSGDVEEEEQHDREEHDDDDDD